MNRGVALLLILITLTATSATIAKPALSSAEELEENSWTTKAPMPEAISGVKAAVVNGEIYVMTGSLNYEYNPTTDTWATKKPMPTNRGNGFGTVAYQDKIYVIGGDSGTYGYVNYSPVNEVYDPSTDTWETKKPMPTGREGVDANVVNGKIYVMGGRTDNFRSIDTPVNEVYDPATDSWTTKEQAPGAIRNYVSAVVDNKIYIMGGVGNTTSNRVYNTETDTWSLGASLPIPTYFAGAGVTTGVMSPKRIYVIGGGFTSTSNAVHVYDPASENWTSGAPMLINRSALAVAVVDDILYAMGGNLGWEGGDWPFSGHPLGTTDMVEQYIPFGYGTIPPEPEPEPFPTMIVVTVAVISVAVVGLGLLLYFRKQKERSTIE